MRVAIAILFALIVSPAVEPAHADPYRWCAQYGGGAQGGAVNCYFVTLEQCRAALSGNGGFCNPNNFYDGRPVRTPEDGPARRKLRS
jgi:hypothetical protein